MSIESDAKEVFSEFLNGIPVAKGSLIVIGCSTSEVLGEKMGKGSSMDVAENIYTIISEMAQEKGFNLAFQCCEHLNRAIVLERATMEKLNLDEVSVVPYPHAGGSMATFAYRHMLDAVVVESVKAQAGLDIGEVLIGMHLKSVAVPLHLSKRYIGKARINAAFVRPKLIGGERAKYSL